MDKDKDRIQKLGAIFHGNVTFNGPMYDIHDNQNVYINDERMGKNEPSKQGRKDEYLFASNDMSKDTVLTSEKVSEFVAYLKEKGIEGIAVSTSKKNEVNLAFANFYKLWMHEGLVSRVPNSAACIRFLKEDCALSFSVQESSCEAFLRTYLPEQIEKKR